jgi:hypothetical protein
MTILASRKPGRRRRRPRVRTGDHSLANAPARSTPIAEQATRDVGAPPTEPTR